MNWKKILFLMLAVSVQALIESCSEEGDGTPLLSVGTVTVSDVSNLGDGRDIEVSFAKVSDESNVVEYRVFVVKSVGSGSFTLAIAEGLGADRYTAVSADNTHKEITLEQDSKDSDGAQIIEDQPYVVFVMVVGKSGENKLSKASDTFTLKLPPTPTVNIVTLTDISNFGDGRDLRVEFNKVTNESLINGYRIVIVKGNNVPAFALSIAESLPVTRYTSVAPTGSHLNVTLSETTVDSDGDLIKQDNQYAAFVMTIGVGRNETQNKLSPSSIVLTLEIPSAPAVTNVTALDVSNNGDGKDIEISFTKATQENLVSHYRIIVVNESVGAVFDLATAENLAATRYHSVPKNGDNQRIELTSALTDSEGNPIDEAVNYKIFVLSVADGVMANKNKLSTPSTSFMLAQENTVRTFAVFPDAGSGGLEVDNSGNVYFGDFGVNENTPGTEIFKVTPSGNISVFASGLSTADGNDMDSNGNLYSISWHSNQIFKITPGGTKSVFAGGSPINGPIGVVVDDNNDLYVTCYNNNTIVKITSAGVATVLSTSSLLNGPNGIDLDAAGNIYVSNWSDGNVLKVNKNTGATEVFVTLPTEQKAHLVIKDDIIYVAGRARHKIYKVTLSKVVSDFLGTGTKGGRNGSLSSATICWPNDIAFNADGTKMYISMVDPAVTSANIFGPVIIREISLVEQ